MTQRRASVVVARRYEPDSGHAVDAGEVARRFAAAVLARRSPGSRSDRNIPSRRCCVRFSYRMVPEVYQMFWAGMRLGRSSSTMPQSRLAVIASKAAVGWLRRAGSDLVGAEA